MNDECVICLNTVIIVNNQDVFIKNCKCKYIFHDACLKNWLFTNPVCPICHEVLLIKPNVDDQITVCPSEEIVSTIDIETLLNQIRENNISNANRTIIFTEGNVQNEYNPYIRFYFFTLLLIIFILFFALKP